MDALEALDKILFLVDSLQCEARQMTIASVSDMTERGVALKKVIEESKEIPSLLRTIEKSIKK
jgi:hypothetical protein